MFEELFSGAADRGASVPDEERKKAVRAAMVRALANQLGPLADRFGSRVNRLGMAGQFVPTPDFDDSSMPPGAAGGAPMPDLSSAGDYFSNENPQDAGFSGFPGAPEDGYEADFAAMGLGGSSAPANDMSDIAWNGTPDPVLTNLDPADASGPVGSSAQGEKSQNPAAGPKCDEKKVDQSGIIWSSNFDCEYSDGVTVAQSSSMDKYMVDVLPNYRSEGKKEKILSFSADGNYERVDRSSKPFGDPSSSKIMKTTGVPIENAVATGHSHPEPGNIEPEFIDYKEIEDHRRTNNIVHGIKGRRGKPDNVRIIVIEKIKGHYRVRLLVGSLVHDEESKIKRRLSRFQDISKWRVIKRRRNQEKSRNRRQR